MPPSPEPDALIAAFASPANLATALIAVNFIAFALFGIDKSLAEAGRWRVAEKTLLLWAWLGGTPGAYAGRALFRHKTRKQPFSSNLRAVAVLAVFAYHLDYKWAQGGYLGVDTFFVLSGFLITTLLLGRNG